MSKALKILINGVTLENASLSALVAKINCWQKRGTECWLLGNQELKRRIIQDYALNQKINYLKIKKTKKIKTKTDLVIEGLKRNWQLIKNTKQHKNFKKVYSISSVLDLIIFPFFLKMVNPHIRWYSVFDNKVSLTDPGPKFSRFLSWLFFQLSLLLLKKADYIFVISKELKKYLIKRKLNPDKLMVTGNAVESDLIQKAKRGKKFSFDALFVGRINEAKGIDDLLDVLKIVKKTYPFFKLAIMGQGDARTEKQYKNEVIKRKLKQNIKFLGFKIGLKKFKLIKDSKLFLFLSHSESFGVALLEAVCCGLPALAYDLPCYRRLYKNDEVFFFKKGDSRRVADKILEIFKKKSFVNKRGRKLVNKYSWSKIADKEFRTFNN